MTNINSVLVSGSSGFIGSALSTNLSKNNIHVRKLVRKEPSDPDSIFWKPSENYIDKNRLSDIDAVVHLAGESVFALRWNEAKKKRIRDSRVNGTKLLAEALAALDNPPKVLVCASAIGIYGNRGEEELTENSTYGGDFLAEVTKEWERATEPASNAGIRVVNLRIGIVLGKNGGALKQMLPFFKLGLGGRVGGGKQYMSWISIEDIVKIVNFCLQNESVSGAVNCTAPTPVTNSEFTKALGKVLKRPTPFLIPEIAMKLIFGEMADYALCSLRVKPEKLLLNGYKFEFEDLSEAIKAAL